MPAQSGLSFQRAIINFEVDLAQKAKQISQKKRLDHYDFHIEAKRMHDGNKVGLSLVCTFMKYKTADQSDLEKQYCCVFAEGTLLDPQRAGNDYKFEKTLAFPESLRKDKGTNLDVLSIDDVRNMSRGGIYSIEVQIRFLANERPGTACLDTHNFERPWENSDIVFRVDGKDVHCHGNVVSQCKKLKTYLDKYYEEMDKRLKHLEEEESSDEELTAGEVSRKLAKPIELKESTKHANFVRLLKLFYPATFNLDLDEKLIYQLADTLVEYNVFTRKAASRLKDIVDKTNAVRCLQMAYKFKHDGLRERSLEVITRMKPKDLRKDPFLKSLDQDAMMELQEARVFDTEEKKIDKNMALPQRERTKVDPGRSKTPVARPGASTSNGSRGAVDRSGKRWKYTPK